MNKQNKTTDWWFFADQKYKDVYEISILGQIIFKIFKKYIIIKPNFSPFRTYKRFNKILSFICVKISKNQPKKSWKKFCLIWCKQSNEINTLQRI